MPKLPTGVTHEKATGRLIVRFMADGERYFRTLDEGKTVADAKALMASMRSELEGTGKIASTAGRAERYTLSDMMHAVEVRYRLEKRAAATLVRLEGNMRLHLFPYFGENIAAATITRDQIEAYRLHRQQETTKDARGRVHQGAKDASINIELAMLRRGFSLALENEKLVKAPKIVTPDPQNARGRILTEAEEAAILKHLPPYFQDVFEIGMSLGWRIKSELLPRVWSDYNPKARTLCIPADAAYQTKNKEPRVCALSDRAVEILERLRTERKARKVVALHPDASKPDYIFLGRGGKDRIRGYGHIFTQALIKAGLPWKADVPNRITLHCARGTFIRRCRDSGIAPEVICSYTGHSRNSRMLQRYYGDVSPEAQRAVTDIFNRKPANGFSTRELPEASPAD